MDGMDDFPRPVSDPAAEGLPETADDDSTAYDDVESSRIADGPDPAKLVNAYFAGKGAFSLSYTRNGYAIP